MTCRALLTLVLIIVSLSRYSLAQTQERPNILFVIGDDWSAGDAGVYDNPVLNTPNLNAIGRDGAVFLNAFCAAPSCTPSRASVLTGKYPHELEAGASLWGYLPKKYPNYTRILEGAAYHVGFAGKGWGPGNFEAGGYEENPAGKGYEDFASFFAAKPDGKPFSFWFGSRNPHRPYDAGSGERSGMDPEKVKVPAWLPDAPEVRKDLLDYYFEIEEFDRELGQILDILRSAGALDNTLIIITGDNGMPFPRAKATLYDPGTKVPLLVSLKGKIQPGTIVEELVCLTDIAPTILEATGQSIPSGVRGKTLWPLLKNEKVTNRDVVFIGRERHANVRRFELGYPARAIRTNDFLYIRNYEPERWPAGDPQLYHSVGPYGDTDAGPSKEYILKHRADPAVRPFFERAFDKRPADELYDLRKDPHQLKNVASDTKYQKKLESLKEQLAEWQFSTGDPRAAHGHPVVFDQYPYYGPPVPGATSTYKPPLDKR